VPRSPGQLGLPLVLRSRHRGQVPDHSVFSRAGNERFRDHDIFRQVFERVVDACIKAGLVGGEAFAVDASLIEADANKSRSIPGPEWNKEIDPERVVR
jgi:transposase